MADKPKLKLVELDSDQLRTLLKEGLLKLEKDGLRISLAVSREDIGEICEEVAAESATQEGDDEDLDEGGGEGVT